MKRSKVLVVGLGEVGRALYEILKECSEFIVYGWDIDEEKVRSIGQRSLPDRIDIMHICYPCFDQDEFIKSTLEYMRRFKPKLTIINSTIPPGTTEAIYKESGGMRIAHSPIRGMHKTLETMKKDIRSWIKYIGGADQKSAELARKHFETVGLKTKVLGKPVETELAKLLNTTYRALLIAWFQEMHRIARHFKADFTAVVDFIEDTHRRRLDRPIMFPDVIGGHCLIPNAKLLLESYDSEFIRLILESNEKRKDEVRDEEIREEISKIRERARRLESELRELRKI